MGVGEGVDQSRPPSEGVGEGVGQSRPPKWFKTDPEIRLIEN